MKPLPKTIPEQRIEALRILDKGSYTASEVTDKLPTHLRSHVNKQLSNYESNGFCAKVTGSKPIKYRLTPYGKHVVKNASKIIIKKLTASGKKPNKKKEVIPAPQPFNISPLGDRFSNLASDLIQENEAYRNLLLQLYNTIGNALEINKPEDEKG